MAETIKTILTADSSELVSEFNKASAVAHKYAQDRESQANRALSAARSEVEALKLEASGHSASATALREKIQLIDSARRLSAQTGITEESANEILAQQLKLKQQIVSATSANAEAAQRAARIAAPGRSGVALPEVVLTETSLQSMEKGNARLAELKKKIASGGGGHGEGENNAYGKAMAFHDLAKAAQDAQYGMAGVGKSIASAVMSFGGSDPKIMRLSTLISLVAVAGYAAFEAGKKLAADPSYVKWAETAAAAVTAAKESLERYQEATRKRETQEQITRDINLEQGKGNRLIEYALKLDQDRLHAIEKQHEAVQRKRAAEDSVLAAAGASGKYAPSAVIATTRRAEDSRAVEDAAAAQARLTEQGKEWERIWHETSRVAGEFAAKSSSNSSTFEKASSELDILKSKKEELTVINKDTTGLTANDRNRFQEELKTINKQIVEKETLIEKTKAEASANESLAEKAASQEKTSLEQIRKLQEGERDRLEQVKEGIALRNTLRQLEDARYDKASKDWNTELDIQKVLGSQDMERFATLQRLKEIEAEKLSILNSQKNVTEAQAQAMAKQMVDAKADAAAAPAKKAYSEELEILRARAIGDNNRAGQLRSAATLEREILNIMKEQNVSRYEASRMAKERMDLERKEARGDVIGEMKALKMQASGDKEGADRLREEMRIRKESVDLAEKLGITESQAQSFLREKARLQKQITDQEKDRHRLRPHHQGVLPHDDWQQSGARHVQGARESQYGLRPHELHRRDNHRSNRPRNPSDDYSKQLIKSVNIQEEMLKIWQKLNLV